MNTQIIHEKQSMEYLQWSQIRSSSGTAGSFLKATDESRSFSINRQWKHFDKWVRLTRMTA